MIRNIVFDMGQVLIRFDPKAFMEELEVPRRDRPLFLREVFRSVEWVQMDRGTLDEVSGAEAMCARLPLRLRDKARAMVLDWWKGPLVPVEGMGELIAQLKEAGYGIYLLSNATPRCHEYFPRIPGSGCFDGKIVSADWKELKPEREIYRTLFREYSLKPEECFFIDDLPINIEGAAFAGMGGTVFRDDLPRLRRELRAAGVEVPLE